jgi:hypothetical protein
VSGNDQSTKQGKLLKERWVHQWLTWSCRRKGKQHLSLPMSLSLCLSLSHSLPTPPPPCTQTRMHTHRRL